MKQAAKQSTAVKQEHGKAADSDSDSDVEILEEDAPEKGSLSGFHRAIRDTGRANVLLALQVALQLVLCAVLISALNVKGTCPLRDGHRSYTFPVLICAGAKHLSSALPPDPARNRALG